MTADEAFVADALESSQLLLTNIANTIRGNPPLGSSWSHHDLVMLVSEMRRSLDGTPFAERMERQRKVFIAQAAEYERTGQLPK